MKKKLLSNLAVLNQFITSGIFLVIIFSCTSISAQVSFTQTSDADFNKGFLDGVLVSGNDFYLPNKATSVNSWLTTSILPDILEGHQMVTWKNTYVFLTGGYNGSAYSSSVYKASISGGGIGGWTSLNALPVPLRDHAVVVGINTIYVLGGRTNGAPSDAIYYASINSDGTIGSWQTSGITLPQPLWGHTAQYVNGYIYVVGGTNVASETTALDKSWYANIGPYDDLSTFSATAILPDSVNRHTMVSFDSKLFVLGGIDEFGNKKNTVFSAETNTNGALSAWQTETALPVSITDHSSTCFNGMVTVMGGDHGGLISNDVYYADISAGTLSWALSPYSIIDRTKEGQAFAANGQIIYAGGENLSGTPIHNVRYAPVTLSSDKVNEAGFVSYPFFQLGDEREVFNLTYSLTNTAFSSYEIYFRTAGNSAVWSNWTNAGTSNPAMISQTTRYVQYMFRLSATSTDNINVHYVSLMIAGSELTGNLNGVDTLFKALSPYWATADISWTSGTHVIEPGVSVLFMPATGFTIGQANVKCVGTAADSILFTYFTSNTTGQWWGIYFDPNSDNGVSSQMSYTIIENAGYGGNDANLYCSSTGQPYITHCTFREAEGNGIVLSGSHLNIENTLFTNNTESGLYCGGSNPTLINTTSSYNGSAGIYLSSTSSVPNYFNTTLDNNLYGLYYGTPNIDMSPPSGSLSITNNTYNGYVVPGGQISTDRNWEHTGFEYYVLGNITIYGPYNSHSRLTIEPGITLNFESGAYIRVGYSGNYGGELYAIGTADSLITFTSFNGLSGGWEGIHFTNYSDIFGSVSVLDYCTVENGNQYNIYCYSTLQPYIDHSDIDNSFEAGMKLGAGANITVANCSFTGNQDGILINNSTPVITNCDFVNQSRGAIYCDPPNSYPVLSGYTFSGNLYNGIAYAPGTLSSSGTWDRDVTHFLTGNLTVRSLVYNSTVTLTIESGAMVKAETGVLFQVGYNDSNYGSGGLMAIGTSADPITFTPLNGLSGGWEGIYFQDYNDSHGGASQLKNCIIEKGNAYNLFLENTTQPSSIDSCTISDGAGYGFRVTLSTPVISNTSISNHADAAVYCTSMNTFALLSENTYTGNLYDGVVYPGGTMDVNGTWADHCDYFIMGDMTMTSATYNTPRYLTIEPGTDVYFASGAKLQVGTNNSNYGAGCITANATSDSLITFSPMSGTQGDWEGISFLDYTDSYGGTSILENCIVEKVNAISISLSNTSQPTIDTCIIRDGLGIGIHNTNSSSLIKNSQILNHDSSAVYCANMNTFANLSGNTYSGNLYNGVEYPGGTMNVNGTWKGQCEYIVKGDLIITSPVYNTPRYLTIEHSINIRMASGTEIVVGTNDIHYGTGGIRANGIAGGEITFSPLSGMSGDWEGIHFTNYTDSHGATSWLNNCVLDKSNAYNLFMESTAQPVIDSSDLSNSLGYGIHLSNSTVTVTSSQVMNNASYGIFLDGSSDATIGNATGLGCDLYMNGSYEVYNNSGNDIDARYNYWGMMDSVLIHNRIFDENDDPSKGLVSIFGFPGLPMILSDSISLSGNVWYDNIAQTIMNSALLSVKDMSSTTIATATTNALGDYQFNKFVSGTYDLEIAPADAWGGSNSTDALIVLNHFAHLDTVTGLNWAAGDVNGSNTLNGTDALLILKRFAGMITSFPAGDWVFDNDTVIVNGEDITQDMYMLCYGDVNASYTPAPKDGSSVSLEYTGTIIINSFMEFEVDVKVTKEMTAGAISLGFYFPEEFLELQGVILSDGSSDIIYSSENGLFKM
ncbi:MAG: right-handed parallel beta-helix repeat-containing protein [Bacteroidetes bacterium]|nr:right-handed parallel beta-helix repeat-containing protein [Bacteroidota bacterium]